MAEDDDLVTDDDMPVSDHLQDFELPDFQTEVAVWKTRCHELWHDSRAAGDLRAQAQAIGAAIRSLENWARSIEQQQKSAQNALSEEARGQICRDYSDEIVARVDAYYAKHDLIECPSAVCRGGRCPSEIYDVVNDYLGRNRPGAQEAREYLKAMEENNVDNDNASGTRGKTEA